MSAIDNLKTHLNDRFIAPIFDCLNYNEKNDETALKFMCVIDYEMEKMNLYGQIDQTKKFLLYQLLKFYSYKSFTYYDYGHNEHLSGKNLKCRLETCQFFGPYTLMLTHMAINHNLHVGSKECQYCCEIDLKKHFEDNTLEGCYQKYLLKQHITQSSIQVTPKYVTQFYEVLKKFSRKMDIFTSRKLLEYVGKHYARKERLDNNYDGDISPDIIRNGPRTKQKPISTEKLNEAFDLAMIQMNWGAGFVMVSQILKSYLNY